MYSNNIVYKNSKMEYSSIRLIIWRNGENFNLIDELDFLLL